MKRSKRLLAIILAVVLVLGMTTPGFAAYGGIENGELRVENEDQLLNLGCDNGTYSEDAATEQTATPSDLPTMDVQTTSPAALSPAYIGIMPTQITTPLHLTAGAANSASGPGWNWNGSTLALSGIDLAVTNGPAIQLPGGSTITLATGTTNTITNAQTGGANNALGIQALGALSISGNGSLEIDAGGSGILAINASLTITDSTIEIISGFNGMVTGGFPVTFNNAQITIDSAVHGITGNNITITGGITDITAGQHGINASNNVTIGGGADVTIDAGGNGIQTSFGDVTISGDNTVVNAPDGINAGGNLIINGNPTVISAHTITTAAITGVLTPTTGQTRIGTGATATGNFSVSIITWSPTGGTQFIGGRQYSASVTLTANAGHTFSSGFTATINGVDATVNVTNPGTEGNTVTVTRQFAETSLIPINAAVNVTPPATGDVPSGASTGPGNFTRGTVTWSPGNNPFTGGTQYTASITLTAELGHTFPAGFTGTINGNPATVENLSPGTNANAVTLSFEFPATPTIPTIGPTTVSSGTVGTLYTQAFTATGTPTITWLAPTGTLPPGLTFNMATGTLSGTPTQDGSFTFTVRAENAAGIGTQEITLIINPAPTAPSIPLNFTAVAGNGQVALGWDAPANDGGSPITGYEVSRDDGATWVAADSNTGHTFTGLLNGSTYTFRVRAVNAVGNGAKASETATPATIPGAPQGFTATAGNTQVTLAWTAPLSSGGSAILRYEVQVGSGAWTDVGLVTSHTVTGLANGTAVTFNIRAVNAVGDGAEASATATPTGGGGGGGGWPTAPVITITSQPANATVPLGEIDSNLYVTATVTQNATRSYRWYRATDADRTGASTFTGATTATFPKPADLTGATYYFYVVVSAPGATSVRSDVAVVTVLADTGTDGFPFIDVARTDWFYPYVRTVWENQLFQGTSHNMFTPQGSMTRAMFVQVLANMENVDLTAYQANSANPRFNDVSPAAWYFPAVEWAAGQGLVQGVGNGNFQPGRAITREEMAVMLHNYVVSRNIALSQGVLHTFTDQAAISDWAVDGVRAIQEAGIIVGHPNGSFAPRATATRAEVATIFARFLEVTGN